MNNVLLCPLQTSALTHVHWTLGLVEMYPLSTLPSAHSHSHAQCLTLLSVGTRTHNDHQVPVVSVGTRPHVPTVLPCLLQAPAFTCPLLSSYCTSLLSIGTWSPMLTAPLWSQQAPALTCPQLLSGICRPLSSYGQFPSLSWTGPCTHISTAPSPSACLYTHMLTAFPSLCRDLH